MAKLWTTRQPGSIKITVNGADYNYHSTGIDQDPGPVNEAGTVDMSGKLYYATGISFDVPKSSNMLLDLPDAMIVDNVIASDLFEIVGHTIVLI